jgi:glutathionylspermidine synthase
MCIINKGKIMLDPSWKKKVLLKSKQTLRCIWCKRNKVHKFDSYVAVRREKKKIAGIIKGLFIASNVAQ